MELDFENLTAIRLLGRGATGTVFLVADRSSPSTPPFALKVIQKHNPFAKPDTELRARWEISVCSLLLSNPHPFLPYLIGKLENPDLLAWAIPFCPAGDLNSLRHSLHPDRFFSISAIRFYLSQLISALSHLHSLGIVYRDLKPENVLIQSNGHVLLTDFDLSRRICVSPQTPPLFSALPPETQLKKAKSAKVSPVSRQGAGFSSGLERSHSFVGTEEYVSPEVVRGEGHEFAVDWWALGVLAYEMAYGRTPFRGRSRKETFRNVLMMKPEFVGKEQSEFRDLITRLLEKEPERRLGYLGGAEEVKGHPFFNGLKWELLADVGRPPFFASAEEIEEGEVRLPDADRTEWFDVRDYFENLREKEGVMGMLTASGSLVEF